MSGDFTTGVEFGFTLSKRLYYGKGASPPPPVPEVMKRTSSSLRETYLPTAVMAYAVVVEPAMVDNPDVPSYQPYVHGRCDPPALIPLHMHDVCMEVDCCMDTAFVTVSGAWRVHCIMASSRCDCRIAVPMGEQGSLLGVEVEIPERSYQSKWVTVADTNDMEKVAKIEDGRFLKPHIYTFKVPQVEGASMISFKVSWSQKLSYQDDQFCLNVPFSFPAYISPGGKRVPKREKILVTVKTSSGTDVLCKCTSHPLMELSREARKLSYFYEADVRAWSETDFNFTYTVSASDILGGVLLQSPSLRDFDEREMFCLYLYPPQDQHNKVFQKEVIFVIDTSGSMKGGPLENVKTAMLASLSNLNPQDSFNIIAFNDETFLYSSSMEPATHGSILNATQWLNSSLTPEGGTNILLPLKQAMKLLADTSNAIPLIFLITDGAVENEKEICNTMKDYLTSKRSIAPRISTFGIGSYCNHYFLQILAQIGRGHYDCTHDADSFDFRLERLFTTASSILLANITVDISEHLDSLELFPLNMPDLSFRSPLVVSGRYKGEFPDNVKVSGILADMTNYVTEVKVQNAKDLPLDKVLARRHIDILTAQAWLSGSDKLEEKVAKLSVQTSFPSEYTRLILLQANTEKETAEPLLIKEILSKISLPKKVNENSQKIIFLGLLGVGFGNLSATAKNIPPGTEEPKSPEGAEFLVKAASNCCSRVFGHCCCMYFLQSCSYMNNQCSIALTQLCTALACFECVNCCYELCACV